MGHTLGFTHPEDGPWIEGTGSVDGSPIWEAFRIPPSDTVMGPGDYAIRPDCSVSKYTLGDDDYASAAALYPL
jgi:hypothetical protein